MSKGDPKPNGVDPMMSELLSAANVGRDRVVEVWTRGCDLYAEYFAALAKADGPEAVMRANAALMNGSLELISQGSATAERPDGGES